MNEPEIYSLLVVIGHLTIQVALVLRALMRPHREPASRIAWVLVILVFPVLGILAYLFLGETSIGRRRAERLRQTLARLPDPETVPVPPGGAAGVAEPVAPARYQHLFDLGQSITGFAPCLGNRGSLAADSDSAIAGLVADIDAALQQVHLLFYIWLPDNNGTRVAQALMRAAGRGVICRAMADDLGSRLLIRSALWGQMAAAGVSLGRALPTGNPLLGSLLGPLRGRVDLRNHRKLAIIDNRITWCGSQNCADPAFLIKAKYAPWVDILARFEGPIARQNQWLFASDWMATHEGDDLSGLPSEPWPDLDGGFVAQAMGTGPTVRNAAMPELFATLMFAARRDLTITTPYYVPNESMQAALCACARRGVKTRIVLPARNDSWVVAAASRSYYADLLEAGVEIYEFLGGLLHAKTITLDGEIALIGSANMDRRSFDLNYENNVLIRDEALTAAIRQRQEHYIAQTQPITQERVAAWPGWRQLWNNTIATLGPVL
ncbi:MAG: cardiolipin synthase [Chromatiaceae bacterium]|nr:cardiolipin synthase [Chromatiaceae bacterium]